MIVGGQILVPWYPDNITVRDFAIMAAHRNWPRQVYFAQSATGRGPIKIGCSGSPQTRVKNLYPLHAKPFRLLATIPGTYNLERRLHEMLSDYRVAGYGPENEWFKPQPVKRLIREIKAGRFDPIAILERAA